jgi:LPPG:FO 2-phospho-L-lactate transferase
VKVVALAGGVGGAKLADGLARLLAPDDLTIVVNNGDDFEHLGLKICPDLDTVCYTLGGLGNPVTGWGRVGETWNAFEGIKKLGGPGWFQLGDKDLSTHLERTRRLRDGDSLSQVTSDFCRAWDIQARVLPMTDDLVATWVKTVEMGLLPFQEYFVKYGCQPCVTGFEFKGAKESKPAPGVLDAIYAADAIVVCPSNPMVSIGPILAISEVYDALLTKKFILAVSPIINGKAVKGPAAKMFDELGVNPSASEVARQYREWVHGIFIDHSDLELEEEISALGMFVEVEDIMMRSVEDRIRLADVVLKRCQAGSGGLQ